MSKTDDMEFAVMMGEAPKKRGRPKTTGKGREQNRETVPNKKKVQPRTLRGEVKELHEMQFVESLLLGNNNCQSYLTLYPNTHPENARNLGNRFRKRPGVIAKLREKRLQAEELAIDKFIEKSSYTLEEAYKEICKRVELATDAEQHSAVASLMKIKMELFKYIGQKENSATASAAQQINLNVGGIAKKPSIEGEKVKVTK